ncbi:MAG: methyl-accepting chemotaxis protein [Phycisphaeraceae bacterium]
MSFNFFNNWRIGTKIAVVSGVLLVASLATLTVISVSSATDSLNTAAKKSLEQMVADAVGMCEVQEETVAAKIRSDLAAARNLLETSSLADAQTGIHTAGDTAEVGGFEVPLLFAGDRQLTGDVEFVDQVLAQTGATCTLFQTLPGQWVRVATNVKDTDGKRATGTTLGSDSPVYQTVMNGQTYEGVNIIAGKIYQTAYAPLRNAEGEIVAVLYVGVPHSNFQALRDSILAIEVGETGYMYAVDSDAIVRVHPEIEGDDLSDVDFMQQIVAEKEGFIEYTWEGREKIVAYAYFEPYDWIISAGSYSDEFNSAAASLRNELVALAAVFAVLACGLAWLMGKQIAKGINRVTTAIHDIAQGEGDLTQRLPIPGKDEVGELAQGFNLFVAKVHDIICDVAAATREVASASTQIAASSEEMAQGINEQTEQTTQVSSAVEEMSSSVVEVARKSTEAADNATQAGKQAEEGGEVVRQTVEGMRAIAEEVNYSASAIDELGKRGEQIGQIIGVINDIADQTNLLALNAAIEAARAGEHGRGFAVVADEVRKLAERTTKATEEVAESIQAIQSETSTAVQRMGRGTERVGQGVELAEKAGASLESIVQGARGVADMIQSIAAASEQQSAAGEQISRNVESINAVTRQSSEGAGQAAAAAAQLSAKSEQLQALVDQFKLDEASRTHRG